MSAVEYALEDLYRDQDHDLVIDTIPAVLAWVPGASARRARPPFEFTLEHAPSQGAAGREILLSLSWDVGALEKRDPAVRARAERMRRGRTAQREHVTELAAYGLAFVAISVLMPGRRVVEMRKGLCPDLLFDVTPTALRGVEVAGRTRGGARALGQIVDGAAGSPGKRRQILERGEIAEAHLSLWCASPRIAILLAVKP